MIADQEWKDETLGQLRMAKRLQLHGIDDLVILRFETSAPNDAQGLLPSEEFQIGLGPDSCRTLGAQFLMMADAIENKGVAN